MKIYDCFTFFNELDLLDIRLHELSDVVDHFVIVESDTTHRGNTKPFILANNWDRYKMFHDKITYVQITDMPKKGDPTPSSTFMEYCRTKNLDPTYSWTLENYQRDCIQKGLNNLSDNDWIIVSDCDEIPRKDSVNFLRTSEHVGRYIFRMPFMYFKFNYISISQPKWKNTIATRAHLFTGAQNERSSTFDFLRPPPSDALFLEHAGWHFSYLGNNEKIKYKLQNFAHAEHDNADLLGKIDIDNLISSHSNMYGFSDYVSLHVTDYWPTYITQNLNQWHSYISQQDKMLDIFDIYPKS